MAGKIEKRHERLLQIIRDRGTVRVTELADLLGVSQVTLRRDVAALESVGRLRRSQGSASWPTAPLNARDARLARQPRVPVPRGLTLGIMVPSATHYYRRVLQGAQEAAAAAGARLRVAITDYELERDLAQVGRLLRAGVDGLLIAPAWGVDEPTAEECAPFAELPVPTVLVERRIPLGLPGSGLDRMCSDHAAGAALAVQHLAGLGHRRVALLARYSHTMPHLVRGYRSAVGALSLPEDIFAASGSLKSRTDTFEIQAERLLKRILEGEADAALVHTDADAINLIRRLEAQGLSVPRDVALVSYDDELTAFSDIALTAVAPAKHAIGRGAMSMLLRRLADPKARSTRTELVPELIVRDSCGAPTRHTNFK
jgi:DNA-binding LacI/PurR family transcriptional regulator